jgi:predicted membrane protein
MDRGVFFLASTVLGTGIGYFVGRSLDEDASAERFFGIWRSRIGAGTVMGALVGASVAAIYFYVEFLGRVVVWCAEACIHHPIRAAVVTVVFVGFLALIGSQMDDPQRRRPLPRRRGT